MREQNQLDCSKTTSTTRSIYKIFLGDKIHYGYRQWQYEYRNKYPLC